MTVGSSVKTLQFFRKVRGPVKHVGCLQQITKQVNKSEIICTCDFLTFWPKHFLYIFHLVKNAVFVGPMIS